MTRLAKQISVSNPCRTIALVDNETLPPMAKNYPSHLLNVRAINLLDEKSRQRQAFRQKMLLVCQRSLHPHSEAEENLPQFERSPKNLKELSVKCLYFPFKKTYDVIVPKSANFLPKRNKDRDHKVSLKSEISLSN